MDPNVKQIWTTALRSGKYQQTEGLLKRKENGKWGHCCLGVLCDEAVKAGVKLNTYECTREDDKTIDMAFDDVYSVLPIAVQRWAGLPDPNPTIGKEAASHLNDYDRLTFGEIADLIDENL